MKRWPISQEEEARQEFKKYRCEYEEGAGGYWITEYALEFCECDEDGEFLSGSDYDFAEEKKEFDEAVADMETIPHEAINWN